MCIVFVCLRGDEMTDWIPPFDRPFTAGSPVCIVLAWKVCSCCSLMEPEATLKMAYPGRYNRMAMYNYSLLLISTQVEFWTHR